MTKIALNPTPCPTYNAAQAAAPPAPGMWPRRKRPKLETLASPGESFHNIDISIEQAYALRTVELFSSKMSMRLLPPATRVLAFVPNTVSNIGHLYRLIYDCESQLCGDVEDWCTLIYSAMQGTCAAAKKELLIINNTQRNEEANRTLPADQASQGGKINGEISLVSSHDCRASLWAGVKEAVEEIDKHLNGLAPTAYRSWRNRLEARVRKFGSGERNPVRIKNMEKAVAHLQVLQHFLADPDLALSPGTCEILAGLLTRLKRPAEISFNNVWEIADLLEAELLRIGDLNYIKGIWLTWPRNRKPDPLRDLVLQVDAKLADKTDEGVLSTVVRPWLLEDQRDLVQEYRRDRAMIAMRRSYLNIMAVTLLCLDLVFCWVFIAVQAASAPNPLQGAAWPGLILAMTIGAIGSVLARGTKLSRQPLPSELGAGKGQEVPLGIRSLMSAWSVFWTQVVLGATAALIVNLVFLGGLVHVEGLAAQTPATLAVLSFIAGFSEPFLLDVVGKISGRIM